MRITQWGEYGITCAAVIAAHGQEQAVPATTIAEFQTIALDYAQQILQRLRKGTILNSVRGPSGGYRLARPASKISVLEILTATEGESFVSNCNSTPASNTVNSEPCSVDLRPLWIALKKNVEDFLRQYSLEDIVKSSKQQNSSANLGVSVERFLPNKLETEANNSTNIPYTSSDAPLSLNVVQAKRG